MVSEQNRRLAFRTERLALRSVTKDDFRTICCMENPDDDGESALERTARLHQKLLDKNYLHMLIYLLPEDQQLSSSSSVSEISWGDAGSGTPIGNAGMMGNHELGYLISPGHRRRGYASEAVAGILGQVWRMKDGSFGSFPVDEGNGRAYVSASVNADNTSSIRVLEKVGAVEDSIQTSYTAVEGQPEKPQLKRFRMYMPE